MDIDASWNGKIVVGPDTESSHTATRQTAQTPLAANAARYCTTLATRGMGLAEFEVLACDPGAGNGDVLAVGDRLRLLDGGGDAIGHKVNSAPGCASPLANTLPSAYAMTNSNAWT